MEYCSQCGWANKLASAYADNIEVQAQIDGVLVTRAGRAPVKIGDTIAVIATDIDVSKFFDTKS